MAVAHTFGAIPSVSRRGTVAKCCSPPRRSRLSGGRRAEAPAADGVTEMRSLHARAVAVACPRLRGAVASKGVRVFGPPDSEGRLEFLHVKSPQISPALVCQNVSRPRNI